MNKYGFILDESDRLKLHTDLKIFTQMFCDFEPTGNLRKTLATLCCRAPFGKVVLEYNQYMRNTGLALAVLARIAINIFF